MDKTSTPVFSSSSVKVKSKEPSPSPMTIAFIRQFARACSYEPSVGKSLGLIMAN